MAPLSSRISPSRQVTQLEGMKVTSPKGVLLQKAKIAITIMTMVPMPKGFDCICVVVVWGGEGGGLQRVMLRD